MDNETQFVPDLIKNDKGQKVIDTGVSISLPIKYLKRYRCQNH